MSLAVAELPGWCSELRAIYQDLRHIGFQLSPLKDQLQFHEQAQRLESRGKDELTRAWDLLHSAAHEAVMERFGPARNALDKAYHRFLLLRTEVGRRAAHTVGARVRLAEARGALARLGGGQRARVLALEASLAAFDGYDSEVFGSCREVFDQAAPSHDAERLLARILEAGFETTTARRRTNFARFLATFFDVLDSGQAQRSLEWLLPRTSEGWSVFGEVNLGQAATEALGVAVSSLPGMEAPSDSLRAIIGAFRRAIEGHRSFQVIDAVGEASWAVLNLPDELRAHGTGYLLALVEDLSLFTSGSDAQGWSAMLRVATEHLPLNASPEVRVRLERIVPPFAMDQAVGSGKVSTDAESALISRALANLELDAEVVGAYLNARHAEIDRVYLNGVHFAFPGRFRPYVAATLVDTPSTKEVLSRIWRIAMRDEMWPVLAKDALASIEWWSMVWRERGRDVPEQVSTFATDPISQLWEKAQAWFTAPDTPSGSFFNEGTRKETAIVAIRLLHRLLREGVHSASHIADVPSLYRELRASPAATIGEGATVAMCIGAHSLGADVLPEREAEGIARDILRHLLRSADPHGRASVLNSLATGIRFREAGSPSEVLLELVLGVSDMALASPSMMQKASARVVAAYSRFDSTSAQLKTLVGRMASGPPSLRALVRDIGPPVVQKGNESVQKEDEAGQASQGHQD